MCTSRGMNLPVAVNGATAHVEAATLAAVVKLHRVSAAAHHAGVPAAVVAAPAVEVLPVQLDLVGHLPGPVLEAEAVGLLLRDEARLHNVPAAGVREDEQCVQLVLSRWARKFLGAPDSTRQGCRMIGLCDGCSELP